MSLHSSDTGETATPLAEGKAAEMALYFLKKLGPLTEDELNALMATADFEHYRRHLRPISECTYVCGPNGPVPMVPRTRE